MARTEDTDEISVGPIKALGGDWYADRQVWIVPQDRTGELIALLADLGYDVRFAEAEEA